MRRYTFEDSAVNSDLGYWGFWAGIQYAADGYPPASTIENIMSGRGDRPSHRVLCVDPKPRFWEINSRIMRLRREFYEVLVARYALPCKSSGQPYTAREVAPLLGITSGEFAERLRLARLGYKRILFAEVRENVDISSAVPA